MYSIDVKSSFRRGFYMYWINVTTSFKWGFYMYSINVTTSIIWCYGGYTHRIRKNTVLDCYDKCNQGLCLGSKSNSALHFFHRTTMEPAKNNATNTYDPKTKVMSLKSLSMSIPAHTEIFYPYGSSYKLEYFVWFCNYILWNDFIII